MNEILAQVQATLAAHGEALKGQKDLLERIDRNVGSIDDRLRDVETKSALHGSIAGGVMGVAVAYVTAKLKGA